ncbi:hypothetical protein EI77_04074 [Prosthecobacter fusiformis]|uniref:Peptidase M50B-like protein n=1 Tax=Prosthecobacter fusiformis TaxID=48464 RepID=A0A4R7RM98_9BACT|nr:hypothetical protein [Prosthecobacter fusiformis]TDU64623.1 hypothetical protein EI77_04074 [Prosthecobacter fusiformis]
MSQNTFRASTKDRALKRMDRSQLTNVRRHPRQQKLKRTKSVKRAVAVTLLLPLGLVTAFTLFEMLWRAVIRLEFWRTEEVVFFVVGGVAWAVTYATGWRPVRSYVFGHEVSHLLVARAFGGKILDWDFSATGGYVETNKSNTWITLAPYLLPFYSLIVLLLFGLVGTIWNLHAMQHLSVGAATLNFKPVWFFYAMLGLTWCFHATFTWKTVFIEQSDLETNGEFFSMLLIFLVNVLLLVGLFIAASPSPGLGLAEVGRCWLAMAGSVWDFLLGRFW